MNTTDTPTPICDEHTSDCRCGATYGKDVIPRSVGVRLEQDRAELMNCLVYARRFLTGRDHDTQWIDATIEKVKTP